ncbi:MAG: hypothetical protein AAF493_09810 [Pseudomonadota bacterium]
MRRRARHGSEHKLNDYRGRRRMGSLQQGGGMGFGALFHEGMRAWQGVAHSVLEHPLSRGEIPQWSQGWEDFWRRAAGPTGAEPTNRERDTRGALSTLFAPLLPFKHLSAISGSPLAFLDALVAVSKNGVATAATLPTTLAFETTAALVRRGLTPAPVPSSVDDRAVQFPVRVGSASEGAAYYALSTASVADAIARYAPNSGLVPHAIAPGRALFVLHIRHYRRSDLGAYVEIGAGFVVRATTLSLIPFPALFFPVTSLNGPLGATFGTQVWGYDKFLESDMAMIDAGARRAQCTLNAAGERVVSVKIPRDGDLTIPSLATYTYTRREGRLMFNGLRRVARGTGMRWGAAGVTVDVNPTSDNPMATLLRTFAIPDRHCLFSFWTEDLSERLERPYTQR